MKKTLVVVAAVAAVMVGALLSGCVSTGGVTQVTDNSANKAETKNDEVDKVVVVDWTDRTLGEVQNPAWLVSMRKGDSTMFKTQWSIADDRVVKPSVGSGKTQAIAQTLSRTNYAYMQAAELAQKVIARIGEGLNDVGELEAVRLAAIQTKVDMVGLREETGFFQKLRTTNAETGAKSERFLYFTVFSMSKESWDALVRKYLMDLMGTDGLTTETQKKIGALYSEMKEDADKKDARKQAKEEAMYKEQMARLEAERAKANADAAASNAETAKAGLKAKEMDAIEAENRRAFEEAERLASYLM